MITRGQAQKNEENKILPKKRDRKGKILEDKKEEINKENKKEEVNIEDKNIIKEDEKGKDDIKEDEKEKEEIKEDEKEKEDINNCNLCLNEPYQCSNCEERRKERRSQQIELQSMDSYSRSSRYSHKMPLLENPYPPYPDFNTNNAINQAIPNSFETPIDLTPIPANPETNRRKIINLLLFIGLYLIYLLLFIYNTIIFRDSGGFNLYSTTSLYVMILGLFILIFMVNTQNYFKNK